MDLIERYLQTVRAFLPLSQQDDIIQELRANLQAQVEDREEELGRKLTDDEIASILKKHGHPMLVAGRYRPHQHLIGPIIFPFYLIGLKILLVIAGVLTLLTILTGVRGSDPVGSFVGGVIGIPYHFLAIAIPLFGALTLAAAIIDICQEKFGWWDKWTPQKLPQLKHFKGGYSHGSSDGVGKAAAAMAFWQSHFNVKDTWTKPSYANTVKADIENNIKTTCETYGGGRMKAAAHLFAQIIFTLWWCLLPVYPQLVFGPSDSSLKLTAVWAQAYWPVLHLMIAGLVLHTVAVILPQRRWLRALVKIASSVLSLFILSYFLNAGDLIAVSESARSNHDLVHIVQMLNRGLSIGLIVISVIIPLKILFTTAKLLWYLVAGSKE